MGALGGCGRLRRHAAAWLLALPLVGCGPPPEPRYPSTNLGGTVTIDGAQVIDGMVAFSSMDVKNGRIVVTPIVRGRYIAEKVPLGKVLAVISAYKIGTPGGPRAAGADDPTAERINLVPQRYRVGFELDVTPRSSDVNFKMTSPRAPDSGDPVPAPAPGRFGVEAGPGSDYNESNLPSR